MAHDVFPPAELEIRLSAVRTLMRERGLDGIVVTVPENIYYLTGLAHWGFFACHALLVPLEGEMGLMCRMMERITVQNQISNAEFFGHQDTEEPSDYIVKMITDRGLSSARLGLEKRSLFLTVRIAEMTQASTPNIDWQDCSGLVDDLRLVKSPLEQEYTHKAAIAADAGTLAAIEAIRDGASDYEVSAECQRAMTLAGSEYPGFGPTRTGMTIAQELFKISTAR